MPDGKKWRAYSPLARRRFLCGNAGLHAIVLHCQRSIARQRPVGGQSSRSWVTRSPEWPAGQFFKDPAAEPGAQAGIQAAEGLIKQQCLGARQQGAQQAHPRPLPAGERGRIARGEARQPGAAKRFLHRGFSRASPRTFSGSASCKFCPTLKWSNSNGS